MRFLEPSHETVTDVVVNLACGIVLWWPAQRVVALAERAQSYGDVTEYLGIPVHFMAWFIAIMTFATMAVLILRGLAFVFIPRLVTEAE